ncbi:MAG: DUF697 domain-containing protein [Campylobacterales bacterium]
MSKIKPHTFDNLEGEVVDGGLQDSKADSEKSPKPHTFDDLDGDIVDDNPIVEDTQDKEHSLHKALSFLASIWGLFAAFVFFVIMVLVGDFVVSFEEMISSPSLADVIYVVGLLALLGVIGLHIQKLLSQIKALKNADNLKKEYDKQKQNPTHEIISISATLVENQNDLEDAELRDSLDRLKSKLSSSPVYDELYRLNEDVYRSIDKKADKIIKNASIQAGIGTAISPLPTVDMLLTIYRSVYLANELAKLYGYKPGMLSTYSILKQAIFNVAFAGSSEELLDYIPDVGASSSLNVFSKSIGQGVANAILMARIGQSIKRACRPMSINDKDREMSIISTILKEFRKKE